MSTLEAEAIAQWRAWGATWAMFTRCAICDDVKQCKGRRRRRMICLDCWDGGAR